MKRGNLRIGLLAAAAAALVLPALAAAHPAMYLIEARVAVPPERQTITITNATGGTFKPSSGAKTIPFDAPAYMVQDALGADSAIGRNPTTGQANVWVTGNPGGPWTLQYQGTLATANVNQVVPDGTGLAGAGANVAAATLVQGGQPAVTFASDPSGSSMGRQAQALIANDGYVSMRTESNGLEASGWLNLRYAPGGYRAGMTASQWLSYGPAQTGFQTHATCQNVPALNTESNVLAVQNFFGQNAIGDPFWNYVPWQKTSAGMGDADPAKWTSVVLAAVGVNLNALETVADFRAACEALNGGQGVYVPADNAGGNPANAMIADAVEAAVAPLQVQVDALTVENATLTAANDALLNRPLRITLQAKRQSRKVVTMVSGPLGKQVTVRLLASNADAKRLGLRSRVLATQRRALGGTGAVLLTLTPNTAAAQAHARRGGTIAVTIEAVSGGAKKTAAGTLTR